MARVSGMGGSADCGAVLNIDTGAKPGATITMTSRAGKVVKLRLEPEEFARMWAGIVSDKRFKIENRPNKRNVLLDEIVDTLYDSLSKQK